MKNTWSAQVRGLQGSAQSSNTQNNFACFPRLLSLIYERVLLLQISVSLLFLFVQYFICQKMVRDFLMLSAVDMMFVECVNVNVQREFFITVLKYITLIFVGIVIFLLMLFERITAAALSH